MPDDLVISGGRVVDATGERVADVRVRDGLIAQVGTDLDGGRVLDATGCIVAPGLVDLHVHLREPGNEEAETIETGARSAALGGFTAVVAMPNTEPPLDDVAVVGSVLGVGARSVCDVAAAGCITKGRAGTELAPMGELHALGVRIFTDDGACVASAGVMRRALEYARSLPGAVLA
ncbi:MAG: amidohydrolase family protein, partial [Acidimicrobiia bacterium]